MICGLMWRKRVVYRLGSHPPRKVAIAANSSKGRPHTPIRLLSPLYPLSFTFSRLPLFFPLDSSYYRHPHACSRPILSRSGRAAMLPSRLDTGSSPPPHASDDPPSSSSSSSSSNRRASQRYYYNYENYDSPAIVDLTMVEASSGV